jgi:hypothetical protein
MEMGELIAVELVADTIDQCPFDHSTEAPEDIENDLVGVGTTLGQKMTDGEGTRTGQTGLGKDPQPRDAPGHSLHNQEKPIWLPEYDPELFPLTCAAHHLIPAQASLRDSKLVKWLVHGSVSSQTKSGKGQGKLSHNVGYDVNGSQNGIWLPGPYALSTDAVKVAMAKAQKGAGPKGKAQKAKERLATAPPFVPKDPRATDLEEEDLPAGGPSASGPGGALMVKGRSGTADTAASFDKPPTECEGDFPARYAYYFIYTVGAMQKVNGQYHDAHTDYSKRVREALDEVNTKVIHFALEGGCSQCKKKNKTRTESSNDFPPPRRLIGTLDGLSGKLRGLVKFPGSGWKWPLYTSKMAFHYWVYKKDQVFKTL